MNGVRQGWLVAMREMRERSRSRAFRVSVVLMIVTRRRHARRCPPCSAPAAAPRDVGLTGSAPPALAATIAQQAHAVGITARVHRYASLAAGEQAVRQGRLDVLVAGAQRLEWQGRADEQLKAVLTGAIQLVTVRERAAAAGISPGALAALLAPVPSRSVELGPAAGRSPGDETAVTCHDRRAVLLHQHLRRHGADRRAGGEGQPGRRGAPRPDAGPRPAGRQDRRHRAARAGPDRRDRTGRARRRHRRPAPSISPRSGAPCWPGPSSGSCSATPCTPPSTAPSDRSGRGSKTPRASPGRSSVMLVGGLLRLLRDDRAARQRCRPGDLLLPADCAHGHARAHRHGCDAWWEPVIAAVLTFATTAALVLLAGRLYTSAILHAGPRLSLRDAWRSQATPAPGAAAPAPGAPRQADDHDLRQRALPHGGKTKP